MTHEFTNDEMLQKAIGCGIPEHMAESLVTRYILRRVPEGSFLAAVLCNDLKRACTHADSTNKRLLFNYMDFLYNYAPSGCFGSEAKYEAWIAQRTEVCQCCGLEMAPGQDFCCSDEFPEPNEIRETGK